MGKNSQESVRVLIRCRPLFGKEIENGYEDVVKIYEEKGEVIVAREQSNEAPKVFTFDYTFSQKAIQDDIFDETAEPIVQSCFEGYNGTIFAYGQTGTGKTHTMEGEREPASERGVMPRVF